MPRTRTAFDPAGLDYGDLQLYLCCRDLAASRGHSDPDSILARVQTAFKGGHFPDAIVLLKRHLAIAGISPEQDDVDHKRFASLRRLRELTQAEMARSLGLSPSTICNFENGSGTLSFVSVLLAADRLGVSADQLFPGSAMRMAAADALPKTSAQKRIRLESWHNRRRVKLSQNC